MTMLRNSSQRKVVPFGEEGRSRVDTYIDSCPECGEDCKHIDEEDWYSVECRLCGFSYTWASYILYQNWLAHRDKRQSSIEKKKNKKEYKYKEQESC